MPIPARGRSFLAYPSAYGGDREVGGYLPPPAIVPLSSPLAATVGFFWFTTSPNSGYWGGSTLYPVFLVTSFPGLGYLIVSTEEMIL